MENFDLNEKSLFVKSRNEFIKAEFNLLPSELDILFYLLSIVKEGETTYTFKFKDLADITGKTWTSAQIYNMLKTFSKKQISFVLSEKKFCFVNFFQRINYDRGEVKIFLTSEVLPLFVNTMKNYTLFELHSALRLKSKYSKRLYCVLSMWKSYKEKTFNIEELKDLINIREYNDKGELIKAPLENNGQLRRRCSEWVKELNEETELLITEKWNKRGKELTSVTFTIDKKGDIRNLPEINQEEMKKCLFFFESYGLNKRQAEEAYMRNLTIEKFKEIVAIVNKKLSTDPSLIDNPKGYLISILQDKGYLVREKIDLKELERQKRQEIYNTERNAIIKSLSYQFQAGVNIKSFAPLMKEYGITENDILFYVDKS